MQPASPLPPVSWVLLRGISRTGGHWGNFPQTFAELAMAQQGSVRLTLLDLPDPRQPHSGARSISEMVEACRAELGERGIVGPHHVLAMSLGALVASDWVARYPDELAAVVLINSCVPPISSDSLWALRPSSFLRLMGRKHETPADRAWSGTLDQAVGELAAPAGPAPRLAVRRLWRAVRAALRFRASRAKPGAPLLLLCSQDDELVDWRCSRALSRAWGAPLRLHTMAGHDLAREDPVWVSRVVMQWLAARRDARRLEEGSGAEKRMARLGGPFGPDHAPELDPV